MEALRDIPNLHRVRRGYLWARRAASVAFFDRPLGLDTSHEVSLATLGLQDEERVDYEPSGWLGVRRALRRLPTSDDDVFLDLGSGKGRVVLMAAQHPFRRVIGVELAPELHAVAGRNLAACRSRLRCQDVELVNADVTEFEIPDDVTVVYMCNPFGGTVFDAAVRAIIASRDRAPRPLRLIYQVPTEHRRLLATGRFRLTNVTSSWRPTREWSRHAALHEYELEAPTRFAPPRRQDDRGTTAMRTPNMSGELSPVHTAP